jgi:propanol-preferring alcohol dehydrogenase
VGLPPGQFPTPIFDVVLKRITIRGSIVGTRRDLAEALEFAADRKVIAQVHMAPLEGVNRVLHELEAGTLHGRMVLGIAGDAVGHLLPKRAVGHA